MDRVAELAKLTSLAAHVDRSAIDLAALDRFLAEVRRKIGDLPDTAPDLPFHQMLVGVTLHARHLATGESADQDAAIDVLRLAIGHAAEDDPWLPEYHLRLSFLLLTRETADIDEAVTHVERALALTPEGHPNYAKLLSSLGVALRQQALAAQDPRNLELALHLHQEAIRVTDPQDPRAASYLADIGITLMVKAVLPMSVWGPDKQLLRSARDHLKSALRMGNPYDRVLVATRGALALNRELRRGKLASSH